MLKLVVLNGDTAGTEVPLEGPEVHVGRRSDNELCLPTDMKASRRHARLFRHAGELLLEDVGSANGTFLGQRRIHTPAVINPGDRIRIGRTLLEVVSTEEETPEAQAAQQVVLVESSAGESSEAAALGGPEGIVFSLDAARPLAAPADAQEMQRRLAAMVEYGQALGLILELPKLLRVAAQRIMEVLPAEQVSLLLLDTETGEIVPRVVRSRSGELPEGQLRISRRMVTRALEERLAILTTDATADARFLDADSVRELHIRSAICVPMVTPERAIGVIYLDTRSGTHVFSEPDVHLVAGIAAETAIAVENARLYTDLRRAYDELQAAQEQLLRSERVSAIGMLATSIAHDMANIVSPLPPLIGILATGKDRDGRAQEILVRQADRLLTLVQRLQAFARAQELKLEPTPLNSVVESTLALMGTELAHRRTELKLSLADPSPIALADAAQLERALLNLIVNAVEAMENSPTKRIEVTTQVEEDEAIISVRDTGPGIAAALQARLFEPFFTTKPTGTGLGLYSCRRIVEEEHRGNLEMDSQEGEGTTLTVRLPLWAPPPIP